MNSFLPDDLIRETQNNQALLLYFFNNQCAPCLSLRPKVEQLLHDVFPLMKLVMVDSSARPEANAHFGVFANPTLLVYFEGNEFFRLSKYVSVQQLQETINRPYNLLFS
jgi:thioredoxin 1